MPVPQITITPAGFAAIVNAEHTGTAPVKLTHVGLTAQHFDVATVGAAVPGEAKRLTTFAGQAVATDTLHLNVRDDTGDAYTLRGFGLYLQDGTLFAVYSQAAPIMEKAAAATMLLATDIRFAKINATSIEVGDIDFVNPPATSTQAGVVRLGTDQETEAGADNTTAVTPRGLARYVTKRFGEGAPSAFVKSLLGLATAALFRTELGLRSAALRDEGHGNGLNADLLDGNHGDYYRDWRNLTGVPSLFAPAPHTQGWDTITGQPETATRWPSWGEVTGRPATYPPNGHSHPWSEIAGAPDTATRWPTWNEVTSKPALFPPSAHAHAEYFNKATGDTINGILGFNVPAIPNADAARFITLGEQGATGENRRLDICLMPGAGPNARDIMFRGILNNKFRFETPLAEFNASLSAVNITAGGTVRAASSIITDNFGFISNGSGAGLAMVERNDFGVTWSTHATDGSYRIWNSIAGNVFTISRQAVATIGSDLTVGGTFNAAGGVNMAQACVRATAGSGALPGYIGFHRLDGTRMGYIGWGDANRLQYSVENGFTGHSFVGSVAASGGFDFGSSLKLKDRIGEVPYTLDDLARIDVFIGKYKAQYNNDGRQRIFQSAESLANAAPETVDQAGVHFEGENVASLKVDQVQALQTHFLQLLNRESRKHAQEIAGLHAAVQALREGR